MTRDPLRFTPPDAAIPCPDCGAQCVPGARHHCPRRGTVTAPGPRTPEDGRTVATPEQGRPITTRED